MAYQQGFFSKNVVTIAEKSVGVVIDIIWQRWCTSNEDVALIDDSPEIVPIAMVYPTI